MTDADGFRVAAAVFVFLLAHMHLHSLGRLLTIGEFLSISVFNDQNTKSTIFFVNGWLEDVSCDNADVCILFALNGEKFILCGSVVLRV